MKMQITTQEVKKEKEFCNKVFFTEAELKKLNIKTKVKRYSSFISEVHDRIAKELILNSIEGFVLPYRLGNIYISKTQRLSNYKRFKQSKDEKPTIEIEYNPHSFGDVFFMKWDKNFVRGKETHKFRAYTYPHYNDLPLFHFKSLKFKIDKKYRTLMQYNILENRFNF